MHMMVDCIPCFIKQVLKELDGSDLDGNQKERIMRDMLEFLSRTDYRKAPVEMTYLMHVRMMELGVSVDPYHVLKETSTRKALDELEYMEQEVRSSKDPMYNGALAAVAGNVIDYGAKNMLDLHEVLERAKKNGFRRNDWERFKEEISSASELYYFLDNSGEIVFDHLFMRLLLEGYPDLNINAVVKRTPLLNDVTRKDVIIAGLEESERLHIVEVPGKGWIQPKDIREISDEGIILLSKGQGNYESLSEVKGIYFMLVVKCELVAKDLNVDVGEMVLNYSQ